MRIIPTRHRPIGVRPLGTDQTAIIDGRGTVVVDRESWPSIRSAVDELFNDRGELGTLFRHKAR